MVYAVVCLWRPEDSWQESVCSTQELNVGNSLGDNCFYQLSHFAVSSPGLLTVL